MTNQQALEQITPTLTKWGYTAKISSETVIVLVNRERKVVGEIRTDEPVIVLQKYKGLQNLMGATIRNGFTAALGGCASGKC